MEFCINNRTVRVKPLGDFHRSLLFAAMRRFQATKAPIEARTVIVLALTFGLESISNFEIQHNANGQMTYRSLELILESFDRDFHETILEQVWFASFGKPADLQLVKGAH